MNERRSLAESTALESDSVTGLHHGPQRQESPCYENRQRSSSGLPARGQRLAILALFAPILATLTASCGASQSESTRPVPSLASTPEAQRDFRILREAWSNSPEAAKGNLESPLRAFIRKHPNDGRAPLVRVYLALVLMDQQRLDEARRVLAPLGSFPAGTARDFAALAHAMLLLSNDKPADARVILERLRGKLIDADERFLYGELLVRTALAEKHLAEAVLDMRWWLTDVDASDVSRVKLKVSGYITRFDREDLEEARAWLARDRGPRSKQQVAIDEWLERQVTQELAQSALREGDSELAQRLVKSAPSAIADDQTRRKLNRLAEDGQLPRRVVGRTLGLVLSLKSTRARTLSSQVAAGITEALGLLQQPQRAKATKLLVEDDAEGMRAALGNLAGGGASILVAGMDGPGAEEAAAFAEEAAIPVIVPASSASAAKSWHYAFFLDVPAEESRTILSDRLRREGLSRWVEVSGDSERPEVVSCDRASSRADQPRFPVLDWKRQNVQALLLLSDESCSRDVIRETNRYGLRATLALGPEAASLASQLDSPSRMIWVSTGGFPGSARAGSPRSWYEALGHDAALLAQTALLGFPDDAVDDARIVAELHTRARDRLRSASIDLLTTERRGFGGGHQLERSLVAEARDQGSTR